MSLFNISFDTATKAVTVSVDGVVTPTDEVFFGCYNDYEGNKVQSITCRRKVKNDKGMDEIIETRYPPMDEDKTDAQAKVLAHFSDPAKQPDTLAEKVAAQICSSGS